MGGHHLTYEVAVTEQNMDDMVRMLQSSISQPGIQVASFDHSVVVNGTVPTVEDSLRIDDVLSHFAKVAETNKYALVNAVAVSRPLGDVQADVSRLHGVSQFHVDRDGKGNLIVSGRVSDRAVAENVLAEVKDHAGAYLAADGKIIDRLGVDTTTQVDIKVYVLEVDRTAMSQLGVRLQSGIPDPTHPGFYILGTPSFPALEAPKTTIGSALNVGGFYRTTVLAPTLDLILNTAHAHILSSPDLVTMRPPSSSTKTSGGASRRRRGISTRWLMPWCTPSVSKRATASPSTWACRLSWRSRCSPARASVQFTRSSSADSPRTPSWIA